MRSGDRLDRPVAGREAGDGDDGVGQPAAGDPRPGDEGQRHLKYLFGLSIEMWIS